ncbi:MAG TPA: cytochrome c biogenesis protein CcdA, partial [Pyrinomonadaceae bacterium]|nr:cytochrome c biogenesis protein CcdA [Pyrinomonadaceae bacterium]
MMLYQALRLAIIIIFLPLLALAQNPAKWSLESEAKGLTILPGESYKTILKAEIEPGWHLYALEQASGGPIATTIKIPDGRSLKIVGDIQSARPKTAPDSNFVVDGKPLETKFFEDRVTFEFLLSATSEVSDSDFAVDVRYQLCNDTFCLPPRTKRVSFTGEEDVKKAVSGQQSAVSNQRLTTDNRQPTTDLWAFLWLAVTLGALSLLTPCVFPMIPITVSYFTNHSSGSRAKAVRLATVYSIGIIATFTLLGMLLAIFVGAAGINLFAANPWINLLITGIFLFFAFNLFGAYEITIPSSILTRLDQLTRSHEGEGSGVIGALLMGLTFTLTSFTCTSPFVGTILVSASQGNWQMPLIGMLAFSTVFAIPFFILALVPQWVSQLPRAGGWMNSVKVAMGFLEVAAAMKFISNVDL